MRPRFEVLLILVFIVSCQKGADPGNITPPEPAQTYLNTAYGTDASQQMDIYLPVGRSVTSTKAIILIHGGFWAIGDKSDFTDYVDTLKKRLPDYAIFNINYRLAAIGVNLFPTQENDVKAAFDFVVNKTADYKISQKIVLLGASAGGHLALLQGYKYTAPVKVKAIVDFFGPTDMVTMHDQPVDPASPPLLELLLGGTPASNSTMYAQSSPINFVTAQSAPTLILQGGADTEVPVAQATSLNTKLQTMGVTHQYVFYPTQGHGWMGDTLSHSFNVIQAFLTANVN
jgi:acetyl esterase/lipase